MKHLKSIFIAAAFLITAQYASAQQKVAHVDLKELMTSMPAMKTAEAQLDKISKSYDGEYQTMVTEYQTKMKKYQADAESKAVTDAVNETRAQEMQDMASRIQQYRETAGKELQQKELDLLKPIMEKAQQAIQKVAKAKGVNYVLDSTSPGTVLFVEGGIDISADVKKELGY